MPTSCPLFGKFVHVSLALVITFFLTSCVLLAPTTSSSRPSLSNPPLLNTIQITQTPLASSTSCQDTFVAHTLDHTTFTHEQSNPLFESNGSGLAINDLDNDGLLDIVLANLDGPNAIFWNQGGLKFRKEFLNGESPGNARAVNIIDFDGDGWLDIALTHRKMEPPTLWRNLMGNLTGNAIDEGQAAFAKSEPFTFGAYSMAWADLDNDEDLDLVTGAYDIEQEKLLGIKKLQQGNGVVTYENRDGIFHATQLTPISQALALLLIDLNDDQRLDILVGNDFFHPDLVWLQSDTGWATTKLFALTTQNTMSFDAGDLDNNGRFEIFAADMKPYADEPMEAWQPLMANMMHDPFHNDPQIMANVLQVQDADGQFQEMAGPAGVDGTGWTWSTKFGDLDNDGLLDLYAVNGMIDPNVFSHMPDFALMEENQAFLNVGDALFAPAQEWNLNATTGGRGMSMADLDNDGDLDIVVNNYLVAAQLFENQLCGGSGLEIDLRWSHSKNSRAIGSTLTLQTTTGTYTREIRSASGYLSGDPSRVHFGLPAESQLRRLEVRWPDGFDTTILELKANQLLQITRLD